MNSLELCKRGNKVQKNGYVASGFVFSIIFFLSVETALLLGIFGVVVSILYLTVYHMKYSSTKEDILGSYTSDKLVGSSVCSNDTNESTLQNGPFEGNEDVQKRENSLVNTGFHVHDEYYEDKLKEKERQIRALEAKYSYLTQEHNRLVNRVNDSPHEIKNFLMDANEESFDSDLLHHKIEMMKKEWTKPKATHAVWVFNPIFSTLEKTIKAEDAYHYAGRPYYSVDQVVTIFEEMLKPWKKSRYLWDALEWLEKETTGKRG